MVLWQNTWEKLMSPCVHSDGRTDFSFEDLLTFITGADHLPPLGFPRSISLRFYCQVGSHRHCFSCCCGNVPEQDSVHVTLDSQLKWVLIKSFWGSLATQDEPLQLPTSRKDPAGRAGRNSETSAHIEGCLAFSPLVSSLKPKWNVIVLICCIICQWKYDLTMASF